MSFREFAKELNGERVEGELVKTVFYSLITSAIVFGILYFWRIRWMGDFFSKYGTFTFLALLGYALVIPSIRQVRAYKNFGCMSGMMIGMTSGMIAGFLAGFFVGATNGMFVGGVFGMLVGIVIGIWLGSKCGVMGFMEGIMAGFMGGWMGAMTSVMLINDHLKIASFIIFAVCAVIMVALNYMVYGEMKGNERQIKEDQFLTVVITFVLAIITVLLIVFGPRGGGFA